MPTLPKTFKRSRFGVQKDQRGSLAHPHLRHVPQDVRVTGDNLHGHEVPLGAAKTRTNGGKEQARSGGPDSPLVKLRCGWPFLFFIEDNRWYVNRAKRRSKIDQIQDVGDALL